MTTSNAIELFEKINTSRESQILELFGIVLDVRVHSDGKEKESIRFLNPGYFEVFVSENQLYKMKGDYCNKTEHARRFNDSILWPKGMEKFARAERSRICAEQMMSENVFLLSSYYRQNFDGTLSSACLESDKEKYFSENKKETFGDLLCLPLLDFLIDASYSRVGTPFFEPHGYKMEKEIISLSNWLNNVKAGRMKMTENASFFGYPLKLENHDYVKQLWTPFSKDNTSEFRISFPFVHSLPIARMATVMYQRLIREQIDSLYKANYSPKTLVTIHVDGYLVSTENYPGDLSEAKFVPLQSLANKVFGLN